MGTGLRKSVFNREQDEIAKQRAILMTLSNDLALPLLQVKASLQDLESQDFAKAASRQHAQQAAMSIDTGLQLVEAYRLLLDWTKDCNLPAEPLAIGSILEDIAHQLTPYAKQYNTEIQVSVQPRLAPVLANHPTLNSALEVLGASLIRAQSAHSEKPKYQLVLGAHRSPDNVISAGVFSDVEGLSDRALRAARSLIGRARQPLLNVPEGAAAGILVADMLCAAMWQPLRAAAHNRLPGLATGVPATKQLQII
ncbi:MAG TPA: hypothetical protein VFP32_01380 [Candidatus Saccharimonadales bacterium]|nr:hypothetical protein [Candidatus Saccharimonadales bacterium]